ISLVICTYVHSPTRTLHSFPTRRSSDLRYGPFARVMKRGLPPTEAYARTGELTPPGMTDLARSNRASEAGTGVGWRLLITGTHRDRKSTRLNSSHVSISYAVFCLKKKKK